MSILPPKHAPFHYEKGYFRQNISSFTPFFSLFVLYHASNSTTSLNIWGTDAWAVPTSNFRGGDRPPSPPKSPPMGRQMRGWTKSGP